MVNSLKYSEILATKSSLDQFRQDADKAAPEGHPHSPRDSGNATLEESEMGEIIQIAENGAKIQVFLGLAIGYTLLGLTELLGELAHRVRSKARRHFDRPLKILIAVGLLAIGMTYYIEWAQYSAGGDRGYDVHESFEFQKERSLAI